MPNYGPWTLSAAELARLNEYDRLQDLASRRARLRDPIFNRQLAKNPDRPHLWVNIPSLVSRAAADLLLPGDPILRAADDNADVQQRINQLSIRSRLPEYAWRAAYWTSLLGAGYFLLADVPTRNDATNADVQPVISFRRATGAVARHTRPVDPPYARAFLFKSLLSDGTQLFCELQAGRTLWSAWQGSEKVALPAGYLASVETHETVPLAVGLAALRDSDDESGGEADSAGCEDLFFEIANRLRQVQKILDRHAEPGMNVPDGVLDDSGQLDIENKKVFSFGVDGRGAEYIVWQAQLAEAYAEIDRLFDIIALLTETPPALWGRDKDGKAESGRALKFRLLSGLGKARRAGKVLRAALAEIVRLALRREDVLQGRAPGEYSIVCELPTTFIADEIEDADRVQRLRAAGAISIRNAVTDGQGLTGTDLEAEVAEITTESGAAAGELGANTPNFA